MTVDREKVEVMAKELLFSVTGADCDFDYFRGTGKGGQKRNKTSSGVRCKHRESGAVGTSDDTRSQHDNKKIAFRRMAESKAFKDWHKIETARRTGRLAEAREAAERAMRPSNLRVEGKNEAGLWEEIPHD